jgi:stearoyl-CoA desaturase (delta-9 desaturase)
VTLEAVICCIALYVIRIFGVTAGYHRYFSHKTFKTSRVMQFILAWIAQSSMQRGVLWWASHHRDHHAHSDKEGDPHSPIRETFIKSHVMWLWAEGSDQPRSRVRDLERYPELIWLNKYWVIPPLVTAALVTLFFGLPGLLIGFCLSTVLTWHATFMVNSVAHLFGKRRFETTDQSRNNWFVALLTLGEGWHNNHHHYMNSVRQGFRWWEFDVTYYVLKAMSWVGLVWDLKEPPKELTSSKTAA